MIDYLKKVAATAGVAAALVVAPLMTTVTVPAGSPVGAVAVATASPKDCEDSWFSPHCSPKDFDEMSRNEHDAWCRKQPTAADCKGPAGMHWMWKVLMVVVGAPVGLWLLALMVSSLSSLGSSGSASSWEDGDEDDDDWDDVEDYDAYVPPSPSRAPAPAALAVPAASDFMSSLVKDLGSDPK